MVKDLNCETTNSGGKLLYIVINERNRQIDENNGNKSLRLDLTDESKDSLKKYFFKHCGTTSVMIRNDSYDKKYMKTKLNSNDDLLQKSD